MKGIFARGYASWLRGCWVVVCAQKGTELAESRNLSRPYISPRKLNGYPPADAPYSQTLVRTRTRANALEALNARAFGGARLALTERAACSLRTPSPPVPPTTFSNFGDVCIVLEGANKEEWTRRALKRARKRRARSHHPGVGPEILIGSKFDRHRRKFEFEA